MTSTVKSLGGIMPLPTISVRREHLRKYSWLPDVLRIEGSVIRIIIGPVLTITIFATAVAVAHFRGYQVSLSNAVTPLLGVVVGLILVFRNGTSYDRYYEGRKDFGQMMSNIRNLSRLIWVNVTPPAATTQSSLNAPASLADTKGKTPRTSLHAVKVRTLRLLVAYAVAAKHHLREETGPHWPDFAGLLPHRFAHEIKGYGGLENSSASLRAEEAQARKRRRQHVPEDLERGGDGATTPLLEEQQSSEIRRMLDNALPLPLVIGHELTRLLLTWRSMGYLDAVGPAGLNAMNALIQGMVDQLTAMERVANTPIPASYGIHLKQCVTLYLFALPFTLVHDLRWSMIPVVTLVAFTLMGIEGIAQEIEMPFGRDESDLPLDEYCAELREEIEYIITRLPEGSAEDGSLMEDDDDL